jgi:hypothetical protein
MTATPKPCSHPGCDAMGTVLLPGDADDQWLCRQHLNERVYINRETVAATPAQDQLQDLGKDGQPS